MLEEKKVVGKSIVEKTDEILKKVVSDADNVKDVSGLNDTEIIASHSGKKFIIRACSIQEIPNLVNKLSALDEGFKKFGGDASAAITDEKQEVLNVMADIILMGLKTMHPEMNIESVKENFSITDFPVAYEKILDMNDFLSKMRKITQMK